MRKIISNFIIMLLIGFCFLSFFAVDDVEAEDTIYVDVANVGGPWNGTSVDPFMSIQDAIDDDNTSSGDIILVKAGIYFENIVIDKSVTILGEDKTNTIINGRGLGDVVFISADDVVFSNFTVINGNESGVYIWNATNVVVKQNLIKLNLVNGIFINYSTNVEVFENDINNNSNGVMVSEDSTGNLFYHNNLCDNLVNAYANSSNTWHNGLVYGGNYWDDYAGVDNDSDGFFDTAYNVSGGVNQDFYPLIGMWPYNFAPVADFSWDPGSPKVYEDIQFLDLSVDANDDIVNWSWDFDNDGVIDSYDSVPSVKSYNKNIDYLVTLNVTDFVGLFSSVTKTITIYNNPPVAGFIYGPTNPEIDDSVVFEPVGSTDIDGNITSFEWDFENDGTFDATGFPVDHTWSVADSYTVVLRVTDDEGATDTYSEIVTVSEPYVPPVTPPIDPLTPPVLPEVNSNPVADCGGPYYGLIGEIISFDGAGSSDSDGGVVSYDWIFGDGAVGIGSTPTHTYSSPGQYTVSLMITDNEGGAGSDTSTVTITANPNNPPEIPVVSAPVVGVNGVVVDFVFNCSDADSDDLKYFVSWGDGNSSVSDWIADGLGVVLNHSYVVSGIYVVSVYVSDDKTVSATVNYTIGIDQVQVEFEDSVIGCLFDDDFDGVFDSFEDSETNISSMVSQGGLGLYLIDNDDDGEWDYTYDVTSGVLDVYVVEVDAEVSTTEVVTGGGGSSDDSGGLLLPLLLVAFVAVGGILFFLFFMNDRKKDDAFSVDDFEGGVPAETEGSDAKGEAAKPDISTVISDDMYKNIDELVKNDSEPVSDVGVVKDMDDLMADDSVVSTEGDGNIMVVGDTNYCMNCGSKIDDGQSSCAGCGKKIK